jgi:hypothetical protein
MREMLWRAEEHEQVTDVAWDEPVVRGAIAAIVADAETAASDGFWPGHPLDDVQDEWPLASLYLGSAGVIWGLWKLGSSFDGVTALAPAWRHYGAQPDFGSGAHPPSLLMGETGLLVVADRIGSPLADRARLRALVCENREHPTWELMWGSPGTMLAASACGLDDVWRDSAALLWGQWDEATDVWTQDMYGQVTQYLSPAHGFAGNVHALRGFVDDDVLRARVTRLLERTAVWEDGLVNWPPLDRPLSELRAQVRVQWCHGAPGLISTLGDLMPLELAVGGGELTWRAGPLRKGPSLCHGTAGNGYAFLKLHELTGDSRWLDRARCFAMHAIEQVERTRAEHGQGRYTLWTGDIGVALYLEACVTPDVAFPTIDGFS